MKIEWKRAGIAVATAGLAIGTVAGATTLPAAGAAKTHTLRLNSVTLKEHQTGPRSFAGVDVDKWHGKVIGYDTLSGKFDVKAHVAVIDVAAALRGGILYLHGRSTESGDFTGKVTGGTGRFKGASGTATGVQISNKVTKVVVHYTV